MLMQGASSAQHRFEVRMKSDDRTIFRGHSSMAVAEAYAREYTGKTLVFTDEDKKPERNRGRDMGKPTVLYRIMPNGSRTAWREFALKGDDVVSKDTPEYVKEQKEQEVRNAKAVERARAAAAGKFAAEKNDTLEAAEAMGDAMGRTLGGLVDGTQALRQEIAELKQEIAEAKAEPAGKPGK